MNTTTTPVERRQNRRSTTVTQKQILDAMHEYAWTFQAWHGTGPQVTAAHAAIVALLVEAGIS